MWKWKTLTLWRQFFTEFPCPFRTGRHSSRTGLLSQVRQETCGDSLPRRGDTAHERSGACSSSVTRLIQQYVYGPEEKRRDAAHHQPQVLEQHCREGEVQDGNPAGHQVGTPTGRLGHLDRLKDAYFHIPIKPTFRKFLRFTVGTEVFQFKALPFGLTSEPREFTRVTATLASIVHRKGINLHLHLDDWLLRARSFEECLQQTRDVVQEMTDLGFIVNPEKFDLVLTQKFSFLGEDFDLVEGLVRPTLEKVAKIQNPHNLCHAR